MTLTPQRLAAVSDVIARTFGLHYPPERSADLQRLLTRASRASGGLSLEAFTESLLAGPLTAEQRALLVETLTIGETYFYREPQVFETLARHFSVAPASPGGARDVLRVWSAGCCTGEEAYSLAIMFDRHRAHFPQPRIELLATDINPRYLQRAKAGIYGPWSFRGAPPWLQAKYLQPLGDGRQQVRAELRGTVKFAEFNLAAEDYALTTLGPFGFNLILCRHVLMYFSAQDFARAVRKLAACLQEGGWLVVSAAEVGQVSEPTLVPTRIDHVTVFVKRGQHPMAKLAAAPKPQETCETLITPDPKPSFAAPHPATPPPPRARTTPSRREAETPPVALPAATLLTTAREQADQGNLTAALAACDQLLRQEKLHAVAYFLRASVLKEMGDIPQAIRALGHALYLEADFIAAHLLLASLENSQGRAAAAERHWQTARRLAARLPPNALLPEADGLTAGQLLALIPAQTADSASLRGKPRSAEVSRRRGLADHSVQPR